jgi:hypothetical protein
VIPTVGFTALQATPSGSSRIAPTPNITDDLTWTHGRHTIQAGFNFHEGKNITTNYRNEPSYSWTSSNLLNLGNDITADALSYIQQSVPGAVLASNSNVSSAFGTILGIAYSPTGLLEKYLGKGSVLRASGGIVYDQLRQRHGERVLEQRVAWPGHAGTEPGEHQLHHQRALSEPFAADSAEW